MNIQYLIVLIIVFAASFYAGSMVWKRSKSFTKKTDCGSDCGCGDKSE